MRSERERAAIGSRLSLLCLCRWLVPLSQGAEANSLTRRSAQHSTARDTAQLNDQSSFIFSHANGNNSDDVHQLLTSAHPPDLAQTKRLATPTKLAKPATRSESDPHLIAVI